MSVEEVERLFLYTLNASCSSNQLTRSESMTLMEDLKQNVDNAGPLFQLLQKSHLERPDVSMAVIQVLESFLISRSSPLKSSQIGAQLRAAFVSEFLEKQILASNDVRIPAFLRNKICHFLMICFVTERLEGTWPEAIPQLDALCQKSQAGREIFLHWCLMLTEEVASQRPQSRTDAIHQRNTQIRDLMRERDNEALCQCWRQILQDSSTLPSNIALALECFARFSSWIQVWLVAESEVLRLIYKYLQSQECAVQLAAADCLAEIVSKGMQVADKIALSDFMNLDSVFKAVSDRSVIDAFFVGVCRILNNLGFSLAFSLETQAASRDLVINWCSKAILPHLLSFTSILAQSAKKNVSSAHESSLWLEAVAALLPLLTSVFELTRSMKEAVVPEYAAFAAHYLPIVLQLSERSVPEILDSCPEGGDDEDDEFLSTVRPALLLHFDSILSVQGHATVAHVNALRRECNVHLGKIELLLQLILRLPEALKAASLSFATPEGLTPIGELVSWVSGCGNTLDAGNQPPPVAVSLLIGEVLVRYSSTSFLDSLPEQVDLCLKALVRCLESNSYGPRSSELLLRFIKNLKGKLSLYAVALLGLLQGRFAAGQVRSGALFEAAGLAVAALDSASSSASLNSVTCTLLQSTLQRALVVAPGEDASKAAEALELLGAFARGFTTDSCLNPGPVRAWFGDLLALLMGSSLLSQPVYQISCIGFIQRVIPLCQADSVPIIQKVSLCVLTRGVECATLATLLPLHSASIFKLRDAFACSAVLGALWPSIVDASARLLSGEGASTGTDDILQQATLAKVFLALLQAITSSSVASGCTLQNRQVPLEAVLEAILRFVVRCHLSVDAAGLMRTWCGGVQKTLSVLSGEFVYSRALPFLFGHALPLIFGDLEASVKVHCLALPAAIHQLAHDALTLARVAQQVEPRPGITAAAVPVGLHSGDIKDVKMSLLMHYIKQ